MPLQLLASRERLLGDLRLALGDALEQRDATAAEADSRVRCLQAEIAALEQHLATSPSRESSLTKVGAACESGRDARRTDDGRVVARVSGE